jgi:uncharacterized protein (DUF58 family)
VSLNISDKNNLVDPEVLARLSRLPMCARGLVEGSFSGMHRSPHRGASVEFAQYRKYVPGDDVNNIDWRVYAKTDRFYIKEFEADTNLRCYFVIDSSGSMGFESEGISKLEYAVRSVAVLAQILVQQSDTVGLQCFSDGLNFDIPARGSAKHLGNIFSVLSSLKPSGETKIVKVLHDLAEKINRRALILVFSDFFTEVEELLDCFQHMKHRKHDLAVFHLLSEAETDLNFDRAVRFMCMETNYSIVTEPALIRNDYRKEFNAYMERMKQGCREFHVDYRKVFIEESYDKTLANFLLERAR